MHRTLHRLSALSFYVLAGSFFLAYLLVRNDLGAPWSSWWMRTADLPLALAAITYGGTSLYASIAEEKPSLGKAMIIALPLFAFLLFLIALNFWEILPVPQGA